jgi:hypothetical protein
VQAKGMHNIFNKITENFPNLEKSMPVQIQEASRTPNRLDQNRTTPQHIITKTTSTESRERILKAKREKTNNIQWQTHQNHRFFNRNLKSKKSME